MRLLLIVLVASSGCQTVEFQVDHSMTGVHVAAKFEAKDEVKKVAVGRSVHVVAESRQSVEVASVLSATVPLLEELD